MFDLFYKFLVINKKAVLPGIGTFQIGRRSAQFDFNKKSFSAPLVPIDFTTTVASPHGLYAFVARQQQVDELVAEKNIGAFAKSIKQELDTKKSVQMPGIGQLVVNELGQIKLTSNNNLAVYFPPVSAQREVQQEQVIQHVDKPETKVDVAPESQVSEVDITPQKKEYWWVYAIILAIIAIAAIYYYYYLNGTLQ